MKTFIPLLLFLSTTASAWKITFYEEDNRKCDSSTYIEHSGVGQKKSDCLELGVSGTNNECFASSDGTREECNDPNRAPFTARSFAVDELSSCEVYYYKKPGQGGAGPDTACDEIKDSESERWSISDECTPGTIRTMADHPDDYYRYFKCEDLIIDP